MRLPRRSAASSSSANAVTRFVSSIARRFRGAACAGWTLEYSDLARDQYTLTCPGQDDRVVPGEAFNDWVEQDDGTWAEPRG